MSDCPLLTTLTADTIVITVDNFLQPLVSSYNRSVGSVVNVTCRDSLELIGPSQVTCTESGRWFESRPSCRVPPTTTLPTPTEMDEPLILIIVLAVVVVFVAAVIIIICYALYRSRAKYKKKGSYIEDVSSQPYSLSERPPATTNVVHRYNNVVYQPPVAPVADYGHHHKYEHHDNRYHDNRYHDNRYHDNRYHDNRNSDNYQPKHHHHSREDGYHDTRSLHEFNNKEFITDEVPNVSRVRRIDDDSYYIPMTGYRYSARDKRRYARDSPTHGSMRNARSVGSLIDGRDAHDIDTDEARARRTLRRDGYLWRSMHSLSDWTIPRPKYAT